MKRFYSESDHIYGAGKIAAILNNSGHKVSDRLVARIMHENGMFSIRGGSKKMYMQRMRDNIIKQHFKTTHPNEIWVSDVTYFKLKNESIPNSV